ncbi:hypothetical protein CRG98_012728 [Punica granatum]|nr:hypothetical protein CRG98_012728 [Punica granatum]
MTVDESFKKPGSVPFKWEIRPGVPKIRTEVHPHVHHNKHQQQRGQEAVGKESLSPPGKLKPPPSGFQFFPQEETRNRSFRSASRARSERWRVDLPVLARSSCVSSGCFPASPILRRKESSRTAHRPRPMPEPEYLSDLDTPARLSASSRKSVSPFHDSTSSSSYFSLSSPRLSISSYGFYRSSPQPAGDPDWAGFGLF